MALSARKEFFENLSILPPEFDLAAAVSAAKTIAQVARATEQMHHHMVAWRDTTLKNFATEAAEMRAFAATISEHEIRTFLIPRIAKVKQAILATRDRTPPAPSTLPAIVSGLSVLEGRSREMAKFFRLQLKRADIDHRLHAETLSKVYDQLTALEYDLDPDARPTGEVLASGDDIEAFFARLDAD